MKAGPGTVHAESAASAQVPPRLSPPSALSMLNRPRSLCSVGLVVKIDGKVIARDCLCVPFCLTQIQDPMLSPGSLSRSLAVNPVHVASAMVAFQFSHLGFSDLDMSRSNPPIVLRRTSTSNSWRRPWRRPSARRRSMHALLNLSLPQMPSSNRTWRRQSAL